MFIITVVKDWWPTLWDWELAQSTLPGFGLFFIATVAYLSFFVIPAAVRRVDTSSQDWDWKKKEFEKFNTYILAAALAILGYVVPFITTNTNLVEQLRLLWAGLTLLVVGLMWIVCCSNEPHNADRNKQRSPLTRRSIRPTGALSTNSTVLETIQP
ncbi:hypothetical protein [Trueperella pyogenes]